MIVRIWHGVTAAARADEYLDFLNEPGVPDYQATEGNRGVYVLPAGVEHRFEDFTDDFGMWVVFYGPEGGERPR